MSIIDCEEIQIVSSTSMQELLAQICTELRARLGLGTRPKRESPQQDFRQGLNVIICDWNKL